MVPGKYLETSEIYRILNGSFPLVEIVFLDTHTHIKGFFAFYMRKNREKALKSIFFSVK